mmetsp:Transcript_52977/g.113626  ORF Transcript_52977/g.113626 Transcript_52977/m.113626 type:complete len:213 (-) Transcript_52977:1316-1954(-)
MAWAKATSLSCSFATKSASNSATRALTSASEALARRCLASRSSTSFLRDSLSCKHRSLSLSAARARSVSSLFSANLAASSAMRASSEAAEKRCSASCFSRSLCVSSLACKCSSPSGAAMINASSLSLSQSLSAKSASSSRMRACTAASGAVLASRCAAASCASSSEILEVAVSVASANFLSFACNAQFLSSLALSSISHSLLASAALCAASH